MITSGRIHRCPLLLPPFAKHTDGARSRAHYSSSAGDGFFFFFGRSFSGRISNLLSIAFLLFLRIIFTLFTCAVGTASGESIPFRGDPANDLRGAAACSLASGSPTRNGSLSRVSRGSERLRVTSGYHHGKRTGRPFLLPVLDSSHDQH